MWITKVLDPIQKAIDFISAVFIALAVSILFYAVLMRYIFHSPPAWSQEVTRYLFVWLIMLGGASVTRDQTHLNINVFIDLMPRKVQAIVNLFLNVLMLIFCVVLIYQSALIYPKVAEAMNPILPISLGLLYLSIPVGTALMVLFIVENSIKLFVKTDKASPGEEANVCSCSQ
ncbi:MAG: TRAP transporter small permease [Desulfobacteraceae bacterium]|nr:TRAP transporter small permease [Desulfobacteraceae bacterium]